MRPYRLPRAAALLLAGCLATTTWALAQTAPSAPAATLAPGAGPAPAADPEGFPAAGSGAGAGETGRQRRAGPMQACRKDMRTLCGDIARGKDGRRARLECLINNRDKVAPECAAVIADVEDRMAGGRGKRAGGETAVAPEVKEARKAMRQACKGDVEALCADVPRERGGIRQCLTENTAKLTPPCANALAQLPQRRRAGG